jgi:hypothetical protein
MPQTSGGSTAPRPRRLWTLWLPILVALLPASFFVTIGSSVRQPNGIPYQCPSAVAQLLGGPGVTIRPTVRRDEVRTYDPADPGLVDPPGVAGRCRQKNTEGAAIAFLLLSVGLAVGLVRSGAVPLPGLPGVGSSSGEPARSGRPPASSRREQQS